MTNLELPFVSVIVPVYNGAKTIDALLAALAVQDYPVERREIILIDNGSTDDTVARIAALQEMFRPGIAVLEERAIRGSYAARNTGLLSAKGEIIAFTDADCVPVPCWISEGVRCLQETSADLAGGLVTFTFASSKPTAAEMIDSVTNMQIERDILDRGITKTANLFTRRRVLEAIGHFPANVHSGGDVIWTGLATSAGFKLVFASRAEVGHAARSWFDLFIKQVRVGRGQVPVMREKGMTWNRILIGRASAGPQRSQMSDGRGNSHEQTISPRLVAALAWSRAATFLGRLFGLIDGRPRAR